MPQKKKKVSVPKSKIDILKNISDVEPNADDRFTLSNRVFAKSYILQHKSLLRSEKILELVIPFEY